jgi:hypothetical protein
MTTVRRSTGLAACSRRRPQSAFTSIGIAGATFVELLRWRFLRRRSEPRACRTGRLRSTPPESRRWLPSASRSRRRPMPRASLNVRSWRLPQLLRHAPAIPEPASSSSSEPPDAIAMYSRRSAPPPPPLPSQVAALSNTSGETSPSFLLLQTSRVGAPAPAQRDAAPATTSFFFLHVQPSGHVS